MNDEVTSIENPKVNNPSFYMSVEVLTNGTVLDYPEIVNTATGGELIMQRREIFVSDRKLVKKISELLEALR